MQEQKFILFQKNSSPYIEVIDCDLVRRNELRIFAKTELGLQGNSKLIAFIGIPSMWESQNDVCGRNIFEEILVFFGPEETKVTKKNLCRKTERKLINYIHEQFSNSFINFFASFY